VILATAENLSLTVSGGKTYVFVLGTGNQIWMRAGIWPDLGPWTRL
jgi:hypothetical protein